MIYNFIAFSVSQLSLLQNRHNIFCQHPSGRLCSSESTYYHPDSQQRWREKYEVCWIVSFQTRSQFSFQFGVRNGNSAFKLASFFGAFCKERVLGKLVFLKMVLLNTWIKLICFINFFCMQTHTYWILGFIVQVHRWVLFPDVWLAERSRRERNRERIKVVSRCWRARIVAYLWSLRSVTQGLVVIQG